MRVDLSKSAWPLAVPYILSNTIASATVLFFNFGHLSKPSLYAAIAMAIEGAFVAAPLGMVVGALLKIEADPRMKVFWHADARERVYAAALAAGLGAFAMTDNIVALAIVAGSTMVTIASLREKVSDQQVA